MALRYNRSLMTMKKTINMKIHEINDKLAREKASKQKKLLRGQ